MVYDNRQRGKGAGYGLAMAGGALLSSAANAGVTVYEEGDTVIEVGGRIQVQYFRVDPDTETADSTDDLFLRRLRLDTEATLSENWWGKWQIEFADDEIDIKDAYLQYQGFPIGDITIGSHFVPFSREQLTSSNYQQLVERTFVGDSNFGVPSRQVGVSLRGGAILEEMLQYAVGYYKAGIDPSTSAIDFDTTFDDSTEYSGDLIGGRLDFYPFGAFDLKQGDFEHTPSPLIAVAVNGYTWSNDDDDVSDAATDYDEIQGYGADAALRWIGFSVDVAYQTFTSETIDPTVTDGLVLNGEGDFDTYAIKGGYMIPFGSGFIEPVVGYQVLDADAIAEKDERISGGVNYFFNEHNDKIQFTYEVGSNVFATDNASDNDVNETAVGDDQDRLFLQFQHLF